MLFASSWNTAVQPVLVAAQAMVLCQPTSPTTMSSVKGQRQLLMPANMWTFMTALPTKESGWSVTWLAKPSGEITFFYKYSLAVQIFFDTEEFWPLILLVSTCHTSFSASPKGESNLFRAKSCRRFLGFVESYLLQLSKQPLNITLWKQRKPIHLDIRA